jgi:O-succinylhomoserine sulfhydrylase
MNQDTELVRAGLTRTSFDETSEALFLTSGYVYGTAEEAESAFAGETDRYIYSRYGNPTVAIFEERLRTIEGAESAWAAASGMSAVFNALAAIVKTGDRIVASRALFGSCFIVLDEILARWGITTDFVDGTNVDEWASALETPAAAVFFESPSNPMQDLVDIAAVSELAHAAGAEVVVDNVFASPLLQRPLALGADIVVYSTTKHLDGQGRTLGGAILGTTEFISERLQPLMRHTGPAMSPFNAWVLIKSLETLRIRVDHQTRSALTLAEALVSHPRILDVRYPFLPSHPQHGLARRQMTGGGTVITFELNGEQADAFEVLNRLEIIDISNNLGDTKSLVTHPATTTHQRLGPDARKAQGISDGVIRVSVGLEGVDDLLDDLERGLGPW